MEHFFWRNELKSLMRMLFSEESEGLPHNSNRKIKMGNEEITYWIMVINCFLKSKHSEKEKNEFLESCIGSGLLISEESPVAWLEEFRKYLMVNLKS